MATRQELARLSGNDLKRVSGLSGTIGRFYHRSKTADLQGGLVIAITDCDYNGAEALLRFDAVMCIGCLLHWVDSIHD